MSPPYADVASAVLDAGEPDFLSNTFLRLTEMLGGPFALQEEHGLQGALGQQGRHPQTVLRRSVVEREQQTVATRRRQSMHATLPERPGPAVPVPPAVHGALQRNKARRACQGTQSP